MNKNKSISFLIELVIVIFFFMIVATFCIKIYAGSHTLNTLANDTSKAIEIAQNYVESNDRFDDKTIKLEDGFTLIVKDNKVSVKKNKEVLVSLSIYGGTNNEK